MAFDPKGKIAIIAGNGVLPRLLTEECIRLDLPYVIVLFEGISPDWAKNHPVQPAIFEKPGRLFKALRKAGVSQITMAGGMGRPQLNPLRFDSTGLRLAPVVMNALKKGDGDTLSVVAALFEAEGFNVVGAHHLLESLLAPSGVLTKASPSDEDQSDISRAIEIVTALGHADVGQGAVVAQGICLGLESIQGTDAMLQFVAANPHRLPDKNGAKGILLKAPKPGQDWRTDLPAIGPDTFALAAKAGLAGVVVQAGGALILGLDETIAAADDLGLFLLGRPE
ncbi:MAG: UDP-2,3-diacylglucosamine diphosphatase LpxI [Rhodobacteraceae bacterium]|nr:UDP-2,3-diacylglucosamine diphosphatase LpxI [Paracoccaceae bacterium]